MPGSGQRREAFARFVLLHFGIDDGRGRFDSWAGMDDRASFVDGRRMIMAARFDLGCGLVVAAGEKFRFGDDAVAIGCAGNVRNPDCVANELDQFQVKRGDKEGDGGIERGHA